MKTTAKLSLLAAAFLLMIAGCANNFTPTEPSEDSFAKNVENKNTGVKKPLQVTGISAAQKYSKGDFYRVSLTFSHPVNLESVKQAVSFKKLEKVTNDTDLARVGESISFEVLTDGFDPKNTKEVHFKLMNADKVKAYAYVIGKELKAASTNQKMDQDGDREQGEATDDDFGATFDIGTVTDKYGDESLLLKASPVTLSSLFTDSSANRKVFFGNENEWLAADKKKSELGSLVTHIIATNKKIGDKVSTLDVWGISNDDYGTLLNKHIEVQAFKDNKWTTINRTQFEKKTVNDESWWVAQLSGLDAETPIRANVVLINELTVPSEKSKYPYVLKYNLKCNAAAIETLLSQSSGKKLGFSASVLDYKTDNNSVLDAKKAEDANTITLTYTVPQEFKNAVYANKSTYDVKLKIKDSYIDGNYKGLKTDTLKKENFKLVGETIKTSYYTANKASDYNGISANLSLQSSTSKEVAQSISNITALGNSGNYSRTESYYADVTNTVTFAYDVVEAEFKAPSAEAIYGSLSDLYYGGNDLSKYKNRALTKSFFSTLQSQYPSKTERDILSFIHNAVQDVLKDGKDAFAKNGSLGFSISRGKSNLYISPAVETLGFTGEYTANGNAVDCTIPKFSFGKVQADSKDQLEREGWAKISVTTK